MSEVWVPAVGHEGFDVSSFGRLRSYWKSHGKYGPMTLEDTPRVLNLRYSGPGYVQANLRGRIRWVHVVVLESFVGAKPRIPGHRVEARHLNDVKHDNRLENLTWGTCNDNHEDAKKNGRIKYGEQRKGSRLSDADALKVRAMYDSGKYFQRDLARIFGVSVGIIQATCSGAARSHLPLGRRTRRKTVVGIADQIRAQVRSGRSRKELADVYGVSLTSIYRVCPAKDTL